MKRVLFIVLAFVFTISMALAGCGGAKNENETAATQTSENSTAPAPPPDPAGKYEEPVTVTIAVSTNAATRFEAGDSYEDNVWTRAFKEDLNIDVKVIWTNLWSNFETKMNLAIASNQLPDILTLPKYSQFDRLLKADKLEDLTPYYEDYSSPLMKENMMSDGGQALGWGRINGKLMGFPTGGINFQTARMTFIRKDWFDKTGLPEPKTLEDVLNIARAMKAQDPDNRFGIALVKTVIGDTFCDVIGLANAVGAYPRMWLEDSSGKLIYGTLQPEMKKTLEIYADLFKNGLIDPAFASLDGTAVAEQLTSGRIGVIMGGSWIPGWPLNALWDNEGVDWNIYPILKSVDNPGPLKVQLAEPQASMVAIRKGYEHPEVLFKLISYNVAKTLDPATAEVLKFHSDPAKPDYAYHMQNPLYIYPSPVKYNFDTNIAVTNAIDKNDTSYLKTPHDKLQYEGTKKWFDALKAGTKPTGGDWAGFKTWYGPQSTFGIHNSYFASDSFLVSKLVGAETNEMVRQWANLKKLEEQYITEIISGVRPVGDFDKFIEEWRNLGGETVEYEVNDWYQSIK